MIQTTDRKIVQKSEIIEALEKLELQFRQMNQKYGLMVDKEIDENFTTTLANVTKYTYVIEQKLFEL